MLYYLCFMLIPVGNTFAVIDDCDYPLVSNYKWHLRRSKHTCYAVASVKVNGKGTTIRMHRVILGVKNKQVDHIDHNGLNNQRSNLRECSHSENNRNRLPKSATGYKGVYLTKSGKYRVKLVSGGKRIGVGTFKNINEAIENYNRAALKHHKQFAYINTI